MPKYLVSDYDSSPGSREIRRRFGRRWPNIKSLEDVYRIRVQPPRRSYQFRWKDEKLDTPVFRQPVMTEHGVKTSDTEPLHYHTYLYYLQGLGILCGFLQLLVAYMIRRGAGEAVESTPT